VSLVPESWHAGSRFSREAVAPLAWETEAGPTSLVRTYLTGMLVSVRCVPALACAVYLAVALVACGGSDPGSHSGSASTPEAADQTATVSKLVSGQTSIRRRGCPKIHSGGHNVQVHALSCSEASDLLVELGIKDMASLKTPVNYAAEASRQVVYRSAGWTCWASFITVGNGAPSSGIKHVCFRGNQLILFTFG
jgi:hypothetical protein